MAHLEVCIDSPDAAEIAFTHGATRLEFCSALELGGVTPSLGLVESCLSKVPGVFPVLVLVRVRSGNFHYSPSERTTMIRDVARFADLGVSGFAIGAIDERGMVDEAFAKDVIAAAMGKDLIFHRAFDELYDPWASAEQLVKLGICRILTSGGANSAWEGRERIRCLQQRFGAQVQILPAGGIRPQNARQLLEYTGCEQLHGSFRGKQGTNTSHFGASWRPDPEAIRLTKAILQDYEKQRYDKPNE